MIEKEKLKPFDREAIAHVVDQSARLVDDAEKLSLHMRSVANLLREANYWAQEREAHVVAKIDVQKAIEQEIYRSDRIKERLNKEIARGTIMIDTEGEKTGQVNGLSLIQLGDFLFCKPSRITATTRFGKGNLIDIEREVKLGDPIHSKGVLILGGFLGNRYAKEEPLSLSASLVFEQSYAHVEGDSASAGELCALLSALAQTPIKQSLAITGSVNQNGEIQAIGGVNEKIEGFFDLCMVKGLTTSQGVIIPEANVRHLMLREDVVEAAKENRFHIYSATNIDQAMTLLTGIEAGGRDPSSFFPKDTLNFRVEECLVKYAKLAKEKKEK